MPSPRPASASSAGPAGQDGPRTATRSLLLATLGCVVLVPDCGAGGS